VDHLKVDILCGTPDRCRRVFFLDFVLICPQFSSFPDIYGFHTSKYDYCSWEHVIVDSMPLSYILYETLYLNNFLLSMNKGNVTVFLAIKFFLKKILRPLRTTEKRLFNSKWILISRNFSLENLSFSNFGKFFTVS
jgi:hypothetical protein